MDLALKSVGGGLDLELLDGDLASDDGLRTAVALALLSDRRAEPDDVLPDGNDGPRGDRRGWWADAIAERDGDRFGSRLWLLSREKTLPEVRRDAEAYAHEALAWLLEDGVAAAVEVAASTEERDILELEVVIQRGDGTRVAGRYQYLWR
tara:strand:+ start:4578 stop:5027 length:450 start_codon:yes stop_codon:yes gene_type:complete